MAFEFKPKEKVECAVKRIAGEEIASAIANLTRRGRKGEDRAVHDTRKRLKKLRALVRLVRDAIGEKAFHRENVVFRNAGRALSAARDAKVLVETFDELVKHFEGHVLPASFRAVRKRLMARRREIDRAAAKKGGVTTIVESLRTAREHVVHWKLEGHGWSSLSGGMRRTYAAARKAFTKAARDPDFARLHEWRKREKDLWHQFQLLEPAQREVLKQAGDKAHMLADLLGEDHDLGVLRQAMLDDAKRIGWPSDAEELVGLIDVRRLELQHSAVELGRRQYAEKPKEFGKRMQAYGNAL